MIKYSIRNILKGSAIYIALEEKKTAFLIDSENGNHATILDFDDDRYPVLKYALYIDAYPFENIVLNFQEHEEGGLFLLKIKLQNVMSYERMIMVPPYDMEMELKKVEPDSALKG